jgi:hypothetical protein
MHEGLSFLWAVWCQEEQVPVIHIGECNTTHHFPYLERELVLRKYATDEAVIE